MQAYYSPALISWRMITDESFTRILVSVFTNPTYPINVDKCLRNLGRRFAAIIYAYDAIEAMKVYDSNQSIFAYLSINNVGTCR